MTQDIPMFDKFDLNRGNYTALIIDLKRWNFRALAEMDVKESWTTIKVKIIKALERNIPKVKTDKKKHDKQKWFTGKVKKSVRRKYHLYKRYLRSDASYDYWKYIGARNECNFNVIFGMNMKSLQ